MRRGVAGICLRSRRSNSVPKSVICSFLRETEVSSCKHAWINKVFVCYRLCYKISSSSKVVRLRITYCDKPVSKSLGDGEVKEFSISAEEESSEPPAALFSGPEAETAIDVPMPR